MIRVHGLSGTQTMPFMRVIPKIKVDEGKLSQFVSFLSLSS